MPTELRIRKGVADSNGLQIAFEEMGDPTAPPILLIMGFSAQLTDWPLAFCQRLVDTGHRVIRFDNRDIGLSSKLNGQRVEGNALLRAAQYWTLGRRARVPYTLRDMASDTIAVLDHLGIEAAHVVGASMGGMIAQIVAADYPERVLSLGLIFTSTNEPFLPPPSPRVFGGLFNGPAKNATREQKIAFSVKFLRSINGRRYPISESELRVQVETAYDRSHYPAGMVRQLAAVMGTGSLLRFAKRISCPTIVLHGTDDPLIRPQGGRAVARAIPQARLHLIDGWGHDLPNELIPAISGMLIKNAGSAGQTKSA